MTDTRPIFGYTQGQSLVSLFTTVFDVQHKVHWDPQDEVGCQRLIQ